MRNTSFRDALARVTTISMLVLLGDTASPSWLWRQHRLGPTSGTSRDRGLLSGDRTAILFRTSLRLQAVKRVRITVRPNESELPLTYEHVTGEDERSVRVEVVNWNITRPEAAFLLRVRGDIPKFQDLLEQDPSVTDHELLPVADGEGYCFIRGKGTSDARALWENFKRGSLMTIPPAKWNADGSHTLTLVGTEADIQAAVSEAPDGVTIDIESVGGRKVAPTSVVNELSSRQREAVSTAVELGYYDIPREAIIEEIARELGCTTSTTAEHLQKAESTVMNSLLEP